jgi:hypothetical protein
LEFPEERAELVQVLGVLFQFAQWLEEDRRVVEWWHPAPLENKKFGEEVIAQFPLM